MTKGELIRGLEGVPDDARIRIGITDSTVSTAYEDAEYTESADKTFYIHVTTAFELKAKGE